MKPGVVPKDASLTFNPDKKNVLVKDTERAKRQIKKESRHNLIDPISRKFISKDGVSQKKEKKVLTDAESAYQMLQDMRWVYRNVKGRTKLKQMVLDDDKQFVFMVKELMKIESALMSARVKKEEVSGANQQNFFVVLKGLDDDKKILESTQMENTIDMKQITRALNPDDTSYEPEEEENKRDAPEQLKRALDYG